MLYVVLHLGPVWQTPDLAPDKHQTTELLAQFGTRKPLHHDKVVAQEGCFSDVLDYEHTQTHTHIRSHKHTQTPSPVCVMLRLCF